MLLSDRVVVVTGAGRGIGREIAMRAAQQGAAVVLSGRSQEALEATAGRIHRDGGRAVVVPADVTDEESLTALRDAAARHFGPAHVLVCNSGTGGPTGRLWEIGRREWDETFAVNVTGTFLCCKAFAPAMVERGSGSIVVIGSMTGKRPLLERTPYAASKLALVGLVRTLAHELGGSGVRANLVSPGAVSGERIDWVIEAQAAAQQITPAQARQQFERAAPLQRLVGAGDVADAVAFLASDLAAAITGEDLNVSAGAVMY